MHRLLLLRQYSTRVLKIACTLFREQEHAPKTAGARYASESFVSVGPRVEADSSVKDERDIYGAIKRNGILENGRIDHDGRAKGRYAGLPNTLSAGELNKDFQLARYGEYDILHNNSKEPQSLGRTSTNKTENDTWSAGWMDSPKQSPSNQLLSQDLPPLLAAGAQKASLTQHSPPLSPFCMVGTPDVHSFRTALSKDGMHTPQTPRSGRRYFDGQIDSPVLGSMLSPLGSANSINSREDDVPAGSQDPESQVSFHHRQHHQRRHRTYITKKPASKWKELKVPDFYLKTLEGCSTGHIPSAFFAKEPALSTAGNLPVSPFHKKPLPTDPAHQSASKEYFAPKGLGELHCSICSRSFLSQELLTQHRQSTMHQYKEAQLRGEAQRSPPPTVPLLNLLDCGEFDDAYHNMKSDSVG